MTTLIPVPVSDETAKALAPAIETTCRLIESLVGEPCKVIGATLADQFTFWQWLNRVNIAGKVEKILEERKVAARVLPPDFIFPAIRECGDAADDDLQTAWARLLAGAIEDDKNARVAFVHTLKQLSPTDAKVLTTIVERGPESTKRIKQIAAAMGLAPEVALASLATLRHLGFFSVGGKRLTDFGILFCKACFANHDAVDQYVKTQPAPEMYLIDKKMSQLERDVKEAGTFQ
jgi:hypothetical protein